MTLALANGREIIISEVYCAKSFSSTYLLSILQLAKKGAEVRFTSNKVTILDRGHAVATGTLCKRSGLYQLDQISTKISTTAVQAYQATVSSSGNTMLN